MKIGVIGAGAMGSIYGGILSLNNRVCLIDTNHSVVDHIRQNGLKLLEQNEERLFYPEIRNSGDDVGVCDLVILFVKSLYSRSALKSAAALIDDHTYVMTLQNGAGHEEILKEFVPVNRIIIGTTEDNGAVIGPGIVRHGGQGYTNIGMLTQDQEGILDKIKESFDSCGFHVRIHTNILQLIWEKLLTNISLSAVTGILQSDMGYIANNEYAWNMTRMLLHEAIKTAESMGIIFHEEQEAEKIRNISLNNPQGCTSIRADLRDGKKTEVDTISGAVVKYANTYGVSVPVHNFLVNMVHAMEGKSENRIK